MGEKVWGKWGGGGKGVGKRGKEGKFRGGRPPQMFFPRTAPAINGQCTNRRIVIQWSVALRF